MKRAVVDQPGLKFVFIGLLLSVFIGLIIRSQITESKVNSYVKSVFQQLEKQNEKHSVSLEFDTARLMLSDWGFPLPHLLIKNVKISSRKTECLGNQVFIETLSVPLRWRNILRLKKDLDMARVGSMELRLNNINRCMGLGGELLESVQTHHIDSVNSSRAPSNVDAFAAPTKYFDLYIEKLKIIDKINYNVPVLFQTVAAKLNYSESRILAADIKSQVYLFKAVEQSLYRLRSDFSVSYVEGQQASLKMRGKLIDKPFEINVNLDQQRRKLLLSHKITDWSVKSILGLYSQEQSQKSLIQFFESVTGFAFSNEGRGEYDLKEKKLDFYLLENLSIHSGLSRVDINQVHVTSVKPLIFKPFEVTIKEFELEKIKGIPTFKVIQKSVDNFGLLTAVLKVVDTDDISASGLVNNMSVIFSNQGQRALQKIDNVAFKTNFKDIILENIVFEGQPTMGIVKARLSPLQATAVLSKIKLNEDVYRIFSFNKELPTQLLLKAEISPERAKTKVEIDRLSSDFVEIKNIVINYEADLSESRSYEFEMLLKSFKVNRVATIDASLYTILDQFEEIPPNSPAVFYFENVKARYQRLHPEGVDAQLTANHISTSKNRKNTVHIKSITGGQTEVRPMEARFTLDLSNREGSIKKFDFRADLNQFIFEIIK